MVEALRSGDPLTAIDCATDLATWYRKGGSLPEQCNGKTAGANSYLWSVIEFMLQVEQAGDPAPPYDEPITIDGCPESIDSDPGL
jgi:hypothetical protein